MGFLRDLGKLKAQNKQVREAYPVSGLLAQAQQGLTAMSETLGTLNAQLTAADIANGIRATATIVSARQSGAMVNFNPQVEFMLLVDLPGGIPVPVTRSEVVQQLHLARAQPGQRVMVLVDPADPRRLVVDWNAPAPDRL